MIPPFNLMAWIEDNRALLKPPVGNKVLWRKGEFICMVVGGPNQRKDFHYDEGPEFFYQLEGDMVLRVEEDGVIKDVPIRAGEVFLLDPRVPHSPQRPANSVGLVIERERKPGEMDGLMWFCDRCNQKVYEAYFELVDIETQFEQIFADYYEDETARRCNHCGHVNSADR